MSVKDKIRAAKDFKSEVVDCPEWDMQIEVRTMRGVDRARMLKSSSNDKGEVVGEMFQAYLIAISSYDPATGERIFSEDDVEWIQEKSVDVLDRISEVAMRINGLDKKTIEQTEKNS